MYIEAVGSVSLVESMMVIHHMLDYVNFNGTCHMYIIRITYLLNFVAESEREQFLKARNTVDKGIAHMVSRKNIFKDTVELYQSSDILQEYPFRVKFEDKQAIDAGGVCREYFSAFFEAVYDKYFDGCSLFTPVINPHSSKSELALIGLVISHAYVSSGILPTRISFPCLARILLPRPGDLPDNIMVEVFMNSLSLYDAAVICQGVEWSEERVS